MLMMGGFWGRLCVLCAGISFFVLPVLLFLQVDILAKGKSKSKVKLNFIEELNFPWAKDEEGKFYDPRAIKVNKTEQEMYVLDNGDDPYSGGTRLQKFTYEGKFSTHLGHFFADFDGDGTEEESAPGYIRGFTVDETGNIYFINYGGPISGHSVFKFSSELKFLAHFSISDEYSYLDKIAVGPDGSVYVISYTDTEILKFTSSGAFVTKWGTENGYQEIAVDIDGNVYVAVDTYTTGYSTGKVLKYTADGEFVNSFDLTTNYGKGYGVTYRLVPSGLAIDRSGNVYVTSDGNLDFIQIYNSDGELLAESEQFGESGNENNVLYDPIDVAVDDKGIIYILEGNYIVKFMVEGTDKTGKLVVNTTGDESDADKGDGVCDVDLSEDGEQCTLRAAIEEVNLSKGNDTNTITFDIPTTDTGYSSTTGTATFTISPKKALPDIKKTVVIDAASQSNGTVELDGKDAGKANGLSVQREDATIKGMNIRNFSKDGILAKSDVFLKNTKISSNKGSGVSSSADITIEATDNEFSDNGKSGIKSNGKVDAANAVLHAENNGDYGIFAKEDVQINGGGTTSIESIPYGSQTSKISNNGKGGISTGSSRNSHEDDYSGGCHLEVTDNGNSVEKDSGVKLGNGVYVRNADFYLSFSKVSKNNGYGIFTTGGDVRIFGTGNEFSDNGKSGISAVSGKVDAANAVLQAENNGDYGIFAKEDVQINGGGTTSVVSRK